MPCATSTSDVTPESGGRVARMKSRSYPGMLWCLSSMPVALRKTRNWLKPIPSGSHMPEPEDPAKQ
eukprot:scaffold239151_cov36-Tisochrysis_lutea.AAC.2